MALNVKHRTTNQDWLDTISNIENLITPGEVERKAQETIDRIITHTNGLDEILISYSTGKDSIIVTELCRELGIHDGIWFMTELEYPDLYRWAEIHGPKKLIMWNMRVDYHWISQHPDWLFPPHPSPISDRWMNRLQWQGKRELFQHRRPQAMLNGRRNKESNRCGKNGVYDDQGTLIHAPLYDWTHEEILGYLHYNEVEIPRYYHHWNGWKIGSGAWARRDRYTTLEHSWWEIYTYDPQIVKLSAKYQLPGAQEYLNKPEEEKRCQPPQNTEKNS